MYTWCVQSVDTLDTTSLHHDITTWCYPSRYSSWVVFMIGIHVVYTACSLVVYIMVYIPPGVPYLHRGYVWYVGMLSTSVCTWWYYISTSWYYYVMISLELFMIIISSIHDMYSCSISLEHTQYYYMVCMVYIPRCAPCPHRGYVGMDT